MAEERKQSKPLPLPQTGDIAPRFTWIEFRFLDGSHLLIQLRPEDSTKIFRDWMKCIEEKREMLFHVPCADQPWQEFLFESRRLGTVRVCDDAHGWPAALAETEVFERQQAEAKARANGLVVAGPQPAKKLEVAK